MPAVDTARIAELLSPIALQPAALEQVSKYLDLLLKWNARMNLTAVREPEQIVMRHFGESLFAAAQLFPGPAEKSTLADVGSGAGFPGVPIAILRPEVHVTLVEAHGKKATFLKEVVRTLALPNVAVAQVRAEDFRESHDVVTMRAVEEFASILPFSALLVKPGGRLACLFGAPQVEEAKALLNSGWSFLPAVYFPGSTQRVLWIAQRETGEK